MGGEHSRDFIFEECSFGRETRARDNRVAPALSRCKRCNALWSIDLLAPLPLQLRCVSIFSSDRPIPWDSPITMVAALPSSFLYFFFLSVIACSSIFRVRSSYLAFVKRCFWCLFIAKDFVENLTRSRRWLLSSFFQDGSLPRINRTNPSRASRRLRDWISLERFEKKTLSIR